MLRAVAGGLTKSFLEIRLPYVRLVHYPGSVADMGTSTNLVELMFTLVTFRSLCGNLSFANQLYSRLGFRPTMRTKRVHRQHQRNRRLWIRQGRSTEWWSKILAQNDIDKEWKENVRLSKENFYRLCHELRPVLVTVWCKFRDHLSVQTKLAATLYYLSDEAHYRTIANSFGIVKSTVCYVLRRTVYSIT